MLPPGVPFYYYNPQQVSVKASPNWQMFASFSHDGNQSTQGPFGLSGFRAEATAPDAAMILTAKDPGGFAHAFIEVLKHPGGGTLIAQLDDAGPVSIATDASHAEAAWVALPSDTASSQRLTLRPLGDGPVAVLSWTTQRDSPGILYENHGVLGAAINHLAAWSPAILQIELAAQQPALILVVFGTNEGFDDSLTPTAYAHDYAARLEQLRRLAPAAAILAVGAPDGERRTAHGWVEPPNLTPHPRNTETHSGGNGHRLLDWQAAMGGPGSMARWVQQTPPWAMPDHVHLRTPAIRPARICCSTN